METKIEKRRLTEKEIDSLILEIRKFRNPLTGRKTWQSLKKVYILSSQKNLIGVCGISQLKDWVKLGPFVVFQKYHHQGYGRKIMEIIGKDYSNSNLFIGSRNPAVAKLALSFGFQEEFNILKLPRTVKFYLMNNILQNLSIDYMKEYLRKKPTQEGPYRFFLRGWGGGRVSDCFPA